MTAPFFYAVVSIFLCGKQNVSSSQNSYGEQCVSLYFVLFFNSSSCYRNNENSQHGNIFGSWKRSIRLDLILQCHHLQECMVQEELH